jgi:DNA helicase-2/ATP-dependent DNA helicase PcrA
MNSPTPEQSAILSAATSTDSPLQLIAYAGTGKTSTLELIDEALGEAPRLYIAFNKRIVTEMTKEDKDGKTRLRSTTKCQTLNSLGHSVWASAISPRLVLNTKKTLETFKEIIKPLSRDETRALWNEWDEIQTCVSLAKAFGFIPEGAPQWEKRLINFEDFLAKLESPPSNSGLAIANAVLRTSIRLAYSGNIDFNDQLYMPALFGGSFPRFPLVMVDEAQDLSPINHELVRKLCRTSRLIAVGDPFQSIYGFRGAMTHGMEIQRTAFSMSALPLSISFRCPSAIVENARWRAAGFRAFREGGSVSSLSWLALEEIQEDSAIICRNNAPLFKVALNLLSHGRSVSMAGTDIGPKLLHILRRLGDESLSRPAVLLAIEDWHAKRPDSTSARDLADCLRLFASNSRTLDEAIAYVEFLFKQSGRIHLSTGHKAKGLEWENVYHLDPWLLDNNEQDLNLRYVIQTRSAENYYEISSKDITSTPD